MRKIEKYIIEYLLQIYPNIIKRILLKKNIEIVIKKENILNFFNFLKKHTQNKYILSDITCIDYLKNRKRFQIIYNLLSLQHQNRLIIKIEITENEIIESICNIYTSANWLEREIWDLFGIYFSNHPDLRRILTDYGFNGFCLRKDFPLSGFIEINYDEKMKKLIYNKLELSQEFRFFDFDSPWESKKSKENK